MLMSPELLQNWLHLSCGLLIFLMPLSKMRLMSWTSEIWHMSYINSLRQRQNCRQFADDTFKQFFQNENVWILIEISLKFVPKAPINNISSLIQIMAWRRSGDKPLSEPMMASLLTHICVIRPHKLILLSSSYTFANWRLFLLLLVICFENIDNTASFQWTVLSTHFHMSLDVF